MSKLSQEDIDKFFKTPKSWKVTPTGLEEPSPKLRREVDRRNQAWLKARWRRHGISEDS